MLNHGFSRSQQGISLVELMIGMVISLVIIAGAGGIFLTGVRGGMETQRIANLNHEMRSVSDLVAEDLRRASFVGPITVTDDTGNKKTYPIPSDAAKAETARNINIIELEEKKRHCVIYGYLDNSTNQNDPNIVFRAFRLAGGVVERTQWPVSTASLPTACPDSGWTPMTDSAITTVTDFVLDADTGSYCYPATGNASPTTPVNNACPSNNVHIRLVDIYIRGERKSDSQITGESQSAVMLRNHHYVN